MFIERLGFSKENSYNALELSIHLARYSLAQKFCQGLDVLDVACGEGYGSYVMANYWGAKSVKGVDISVEAVRIAQANLASDNIEYLCHNAEEIDNLFPANSFDMVVSLETIEHVNKPEQFLAAIRQVLKPDGIAIISCPNDHWYYGSGKSGNPYHLHTYYFEEFKELVEKIFGTAICYLLGVPLYGFGNFPHSDVAKTENNMMSGLLSLQSVNCNSVNPQESISVDNCAYFVGIWGNISSAEKIACSTIYPSSMDTYRVPNTTLPEVYSHIEWLENSLKSYEKWSGDLQEELKRSQFQLQHGQEELEQQKTLNNQFQTELERSQSQLQHSQEELEQQKTLNNQFQTELERSQSQLQHSQVEIEQQKILNNQVQTEKDRLEFEYQQWKQMAQNHQAELERSQSMIRAMQSSKFWKLRTQWLKLKNIFRFSK